MSSSQWPGPGNQRPTIDQYAPPRRRTGWLVWLIVAVVVAALAVTAWQVSRDPESATSGVTPTVATPSAPWTPTSVAPSATAAASSIPFVVGSGVARGQWTITDVSWSATGVTLRMKVTVTEGTLANYAFFIMENDSTDIHESQSQGWSDDISNGTIRAGETVSGRVYFPSPKVASTVMLVRGAGSDPVAALTIGG